MQTLKLDRGVTCLSPNLLQPTFTGNETILPRRGDDGATMGGVAAETSFIVRTDEGVVIDTQNIPVEVTERVFRQASQQQSNPAERSKLICQLLLDYQRQQKTAREVPPAALVLPSTAPAAAPRPILKPISSGPASPNKLAMPLAAGGTLATPVFVSPPMRPMQSASAFMAQPVQKKKKKKPLRLKLGKTPAAPVDFSCLGIPELGPQPKKPTILVEFDYGMLGRQRARYHWASVTEEVVDGQTRPGPWLQLVFDGRYKDADMFVPPATEAQNDVIWVKISTTDGDSKYDYRCYGTPSVVPLGEFKQLLLPLVEEEFAGAAGPDLGFMQTPTGEEF